LAYYRSVGDVPVKRHTQFRRPDGGLYREELIGEEGFSADSALLYHRGIPSAIIGAEPWQPGDQSLRPNAPLLPRHFRLPELFAGVGPTDSDAVIGRRLVLGNADVRLCYVVADQPSPLFRNAVGDECVYVESGTAVVETVFGALSARPGDYVVVPRATTCRWVPTGTGPLRGYVIEASSHITPAHRYRSRFGQPITGRVHQPPPAHQVLEAHNLVICNFVPRKVDYHPLAIPVPYYHANVDSDEVMFYCGGDYAARQGSGIGQGSVSLHPGGHSHGPQPGAVERSLGVEYVDELAVMVDTFRPLLLGEGATACEDPTYAWSWSGRGPDR